MKKLKEILFLSDKGYTDLKKAIIACTITNLAMLLYKNIKKDFKN